MRAKGLRHWGHRVFFRQEALKGKAIGKSGDVTEGCKSQNNSHCFFSVWELLQLISLLWEPWDLERNNKRLIKKLLNEFNRNYIGSVHRDVFTIRLADNWNAQILPHAWWSFWFQCFFTKEKLERKRQWTEKKADQMSSAHFRRKLWESCSLKCISDFRIQ